MTTVEDSTVTYEQLADIEREFEIVETEISTLPFSQFFFSFHVPFPHQRLLTKRKHTPQSASSMSSPSPSTRSARRSSRRSPTSGRS